MARKIKFGWITPVAGTRETQNVPLVIEQEKEVLPAVARHFDSLWVFDHLLGFGSPTNSYLECWTAMTWLAARYPGVQVGSLVMAQGFRSPSLLAKMGASLHALTGGRYVLGVGAGWRRQEYEAYGYGYLETPVRIAQMDEAVQIIRKMWTEKAPIFEGKYYRINGAACFPQPDPPPPIMIGGTGEKLMLPLIARLADWWSVPPVQDLEDYRRKRDLVHRHAEAAGRDPASITQAFALYDYHLPETTEESRQAVDRLRQLVDLGVSHFMLDCGRVTSPEPVERFAEEVIAQVG